MKYKGYEAKIEYDNEDRLFFGRVINIKDIIVFDGLSFDELNPIHLETWSFGAGSDMILLKSNKAVNTHVKSEV